MQDVVAKAPKFFVMYKRAGQRVIINHNGDMLVRPSVLEVSVQSGSGQPAVLLPCFWHMFAQHRDSQKLLRKYLDSQAIAHSLPSK